MEMNTYRDILRLELERRKDFNPSYSLRAFAKDLGFSSSRLSQILSKKKGLSEKAAREIVCKLRIDEKEKEWFVTSAGAEHSRANKEKKAFQQRLKEIQDGRNQYDKIELEYFKVISDWYHFAILELTHLESFQPDVSWISQMLGITKKETETAVKRLFMLDLLTEEKGRWKDSFENLKTPNDTPSMHLKKFNAQLLKKASEALYSQSVEDREISATIVSISKKDMPEIKRRIRNFRRDIDKDLKHHDAKDSVYSLNLQFFELTQKEK